MLEIGTIIDDRYEILKEIGRGGMSVVYLAMDNRLNKSLVVKDIRKRMHSNNELLINSLIVEANMLKKFDHGALPKIYDIIESSGDIYVVMDYIEGESLKERLKRDKVIPLKEVLDWAKQLSNVLGYLHSRKPHPIIYRDMKPDNIMLTPEGKIKLIDFGIAREYKTDNSTDTTNLGTKAYAAPEQVSGKQTDARTDIYSLGVTLYHLVTGKSLTEPPFELKPIRYWNPSLSEGLEHIILKCTQSEPEERYQSCEELSYDLENINKLTKGYRKMLLKQLYLFLIPLTLFFIFTTVTAFGYSGLKNEQYQDYMRLVNESSRSVIEGEEVEAISLLEKAIMVDPKKSEAYVHLLDIYMKRNETDAGLAKVETYMKDEFGKVHENDQVLFKVGMTYFDVKRNYVSALRFFQQVDEKNVPDAPYYRTLASTMGNMNIDYSKFAKNLLEFEEYNDKLPNDSRKLENYHSLANIYISYKGQIPDANTRTIEIVEKAGNILTLLGDDQLLYKYEVDFAQKLAQAYHSRGVNSKDMNTAKEDLELAVEHYHELILLDLTQKEFSMLKIGSIYQEMGETLKAKEQFELTIKEHPKSVDAKVGYLNLLLDIEQGKEEGARNYKEAKERFEQIKKMEQAKDASSYQRLERRMSNLSLL
jgi:serine/threonine-protein kinase